jgi:hypothetical protein
MESPDALLNGLGVPQQRDESTILDVRAASYTDSLMILINCTVAQ